ncbi:hypothetical protein, partial [Terrisporobacter mayombei]|uniref:hypothetical protein n=1 Tax=Terrisporobacter mayombei TaxID=1541 RepID=UPI002657E221
NEAGLAGDLQVLFESTADSLENLKRRGLTPLMNTEFFTYVLTHFKNVAEIREHYQEFGLADQATQVNGQGFT